MFSAPEHPALVVPGSRAHLDGFPTADPHRPSSEVIAQRMADACDEIGDLQQRLYADGRWSLLVVFQGRDAAGKDGAIRRVFQQVSPSGLTATAFGPPSREELAHDFLWRTTRRLPERGHIAVFNRSYYEEVLIARVRPELLEAQGLPNLPPGGPNRAFWKQRFASIRDHEEHLARNGTAILKFLLHLSPDEQYRRFLARLDEPDKNWKFDEGDIQARAEWDAFTEAYDDVLAETSKAWAPWYVIPADHKPHLQLTVAEIIATAMRSLELRPAPSSPERVAELRVRLEAARAIDVSPTDVSPREATR